MGETHTLALQIHIRMPALPVVESILCLVPTQTDNNTAYDSYSAQQPPHTIRSTNTEQSI